jgi:sigma-B regulation protein RsbU (phosphoserine phosphatase)
MPNKILVVDDEPDLKLMINQSFRKRIDARELVFIFAENGAEAFKRLEEDEEVAAVLTDLNMPEMDGLTLLAKVNAHFPIIIAVVISAYGDMANIRAAMNHGAYDFVTKPFDLQDLELTIEKALHESRAIREAIKVHDHLVTIQQELEIAKGIQESILPRDFPAFPQRQDFELHAKMIMAKEVGGDFYDFFLIDEDNLGFLIGDVSGKGIPAALFMTVCRTLLMATAATGLAPQACLERANRILHRESVAEMFATAFYGILNTRSGKVVYANGGHNPPFILRQDGRIEATEATGIPLALLENAAYGANEIELRPGDGIFLYTDGVTEAMDGGKNEFSAARLEACLKRHTGSPLPEIIQGVVDEVRAFSAGAAQTDDITILALRYLA